MVAGAAFAADVKAKVYLTGTLAAGTDGGDVTFLTLAKQNQQDADALVFSFNGEKAGANFQFWYQYRNDTATSTLYSTGYTVYARSASLWFKPVEMLKISVGDVGQYLYKEQLHWWKVPTGASVGFESYSNFSSYSGIEGAGFNLTLTPVTGLTVDLGVAPGAATAFANVDGDDSNDSKYNAMGATVKYQLSNIPLSFGAAYRDAGYEQGKIITVGADFSAGGFYGYIQPRFNIGYGTQTTDEYSLDGIAFDNYFKYSAGAFTVAARFPFVYRMTKSDTDPSYLIYEVKASYALTSVTPYLALRNDDQCASPICFGTGNYTAAKTFNVQVQPGVTMNIGECSIDASACFWTYSTYKKGTGSTGYGWSIPVTFGVAF